jgi:hypothetical protein
MPTAIAVTLCGTESSCRDAKSTPGPPFLGLCPDGDGELRNPSEKLKTKSRHHQPINPIRLASTSLVMAGHQCM